MESFKPRSLGLREKQMLVYKYPARFRVVVAGRRFGKTQLALAEMLRAATVSDSFVWYIGPSYPQAKRIVWDRLKDYTRPHLVARPSETDLSVLLDSGSTIAIRGADRPDSLRGNSLDFVVLDEFASMRPETWSEVIRPALTDREGRALFLGTPQGCNHFYDLYEQSKTAPDWAGFQFTTAQGGNVRAEELTSAAAHTDPESFSQEFEA
ncbi:MAG: terminase family protein, partial [Candidatus Acidiferrum sp.]